MNVFLWVLHIMVCFVLIVVVLLQRGKGADIGAALGGGSSNTVFGGRGAGNFLTKITTASAIIFMATSLTLSYVSSEQSQLLDFSDEPAIPSAPADATGALEETKPGATAEEASDLLQEIPQPESTGSDAPAAEGTPDSSKP